MRKILLSALTSLAATAAIGAPPLAEFPQSAGQVVDLAEIGDAYPAERLVGAECSFTPFLDYPTFGSAWNYGEQDPLFTPTPAAVAAPTIPGYAGSAAADTPSLGIASTASAINLFATWRTNLGVALSADTIYRVQTTVDSDAALNSSNWARVRFGGDFFAENGQTEQGYSSNASSNPRAPKVQTILHWSKLASTGFSGVGERDQPAYNFDLIDESASVGGYTFSISGVTIDTISRECLGVGTVLRNKGVETVTNEDGFSPSPDGLTPFSVGDGYTALNLNEPGGTTTVAYDVTTPIAGAANVTFATTDPGDQAGFGALFVQGNPGEESVEIDTTKLYATDLWISAPIAPNSTTSRLPILRARWIQDQTVANGQGQYHCSYYNLNPDQDFDGTVDNLPGLTAANSAKHYAGFWWPDLDLVAQPITTSIYFFDFMYNRSGETAVRPNGTFSVERMTVTEYAQPVF